MRLVFLALKQFLQQLKDYHMLQSSWCINLEPCLKVREGDISGEEQEGVRNIARSKGEQDHGEAQRGGSKEHGKTYEGVRDMAVKLEGSELCLQPNWKAKCASAKHKAVRQPRTRLCNNTSQADSPIGTEVEWCHEAPKKQRSLNSLAGSVTG